ncbi:TRAP transporter large permease [Desulfovibrio sp. SGI.169]|uniref:TRAP transporter large permease n=1 Tax=Desulfovibrio sp. SGI.169 TaxID=3420561 RepID=UPI003D073009
MLVDLVISIAILVFLLSFGTPLPFCFGGALMYMTLCTDIGSMSGMFLWGFEQLINPVLLCIPLFVFAGNLMSESGIADALLRLCNLLLGRFKGALGTVAVAACAIIGAISGSGLTGVAATGPLLIPRMEAQGYDRAYATALIANASVLGLLIPPSINMVVYGWVTETSILACFLSTLLPGLLLMLIFCLVNACYVRRRPIRVSGESFGQALKKLPQTGLAALPALMMPVIILGGIYGGIMTPTESAAVACAYAIPVGLFIYRGLRPKSISMAAKESATAVGSIMVMVLFGLMLSQQFVFGGLPQELADFLLGVTRNKVVLLLLINAVLIFVGMILNDVTGILLMSPLLLPLVKAMGIHPVHFAAIIGVNLSMGTLTPPFAGILYFSMRIGKVEFADIVGPVTLLLCLGYIPMCFLVTFWEPLAMWLPRFFGLV